jgi:oxygen-dependent protoporphyrinogen oxidase
MQSLTDALVAAVGRDRVLLNNAVSSVRHGLAKRWRVILNNGQQLEADGVVVATPANVSAKLLRDVSPEISSDLSDIEYGATTMVSFVFKRYAVKHDLDASGFVVPSSEGRFISACSFSSVKFQSRTKEDCVLLRVFAKAGSGLDEAEVVSRVLDDLRELLAIDAMPLYYRVTGPGAGLPRYTVGHQTRVARIMNEVARYGGLKLIGNSYNGIGIPDCIASAQQAADELVASLCLQRSTI